MPQEHQITTRLRNKLMYIAKGWMRKLGGDYDVEEIIHDAVCNALSTEIPAQSHWEKHCVYHVISECRRLAYVERSKDHTVQLLTVDMAEDVPDADGPDDDYEDRREARIAHVRMVLKHMDSEDASILGLHYIHGQSLNTLASFYKVPKPTINSRIQAAKKRFRQKAITLGTDSVVTSRNVERGNTSNDSLPSSRSHSDGWYRKEQEIDRRSFLDKDGVLVTLSHQQEDLKKRCRYLRDQAEKSHCPVG